MALLGSVTDEKRRDVISTGANIIYHAAAVKHVPIVEKIVECVKTNIFGTLVMAKVA